MSRTARRFHPSLVGLGWFRVVGVGSTVAMRGKSMVVHVQYLDGSGAVLREFVDWACPTSPVADALEVASAFQRTIRTGDVRTIIWTRA